MKKIISILLVLCLCVGLFSALGTVVWAAETASDAPAYKIDFSKSASVQPNFYSVIYNAQGHAVSVDFDYYLPEETSTCIVIEVSGGSYNDSTTGNNSLTVGTHHFSCTMDHSPYACLAPGIQMDRSEGKTIYVWNIRYTLDGVEQIWTPQGSASYEPITYGDIPFTKIPAYRLEPQSVNDTCYADKVIYDGWWNADATATFSFDYFLPEGNAAQITDLSDGGRIYADDISGITELTGNGHFSVTKTNFGAIFCPRFQMDGGVMYVWNLQLTVSGFNPGTVTDGIYTALAHSENFVVTDMFYDDIPFGGEVEEPETPTEPTADTLAYRLDYSGESGSLYPTEFLNVLYDQPDGTVWTYSFDYFIPDKQHRVTVTNAVNGTPFAGNVSELGESGFYSGTLTAGGAMAPALQEDVGGDVIYIWNVKLLKNGEAVDYATAGTETIAVMTYGEIPFPGAIGYKLEPNSVQETFYIDNSTVYADWWDADSVATFSFDYYLPDDNIAKVTDLSGDGTTYADDTTGATVLSGKGHYSVTKSNYGKLFSPRIETGNVMYVWNVQFETFGFPHSLTDGAHTTVKTSEGYRYTEMPVSEIEKQQHTHTYDENGICTVCGAAMPVTYVDLSQQADGNGYAAWMFFVNYQSGNKPITIDFDYYVPGDYNNLIQVADCAAGGGITHVADADFLPAGSGHYSASLNWIYNDGTFAPGLISKTGNGAKMYIWNIVITVDGEAQIVNPNGPQAVCTSANYYDIPFQTGDANSDGLCDVRDLIRVKKYLADNAVSLQFANADIITDMVIDAKDIAAIKRLVLGTFYAKIKTGSMTSEYDGVADAMRTAIVGSADTPFAKSGLFSKIYYVSESGNDNNNGTSPATPWRSLEKVNNAKPVSGSVVLFERGSIFRGHLDLQSGVTYAAYGNGDKPRIYGSDQNYAESVWQNEGNGIWSVQTNESADIGNIIFNEGDFFGRKLKYKDLDEKGWTYWNENKNDSSKFSPVVYDDYDPYDFWFNYDNGKVYLYSPNGNPSALFDSIEMAGGYHVLKAKNEAHDITIENLCVRYGGKHGISFGNCTQINISKCEIGYIGGALQQDSLDREACRYGNGIEFYGTACKNISVTDCWVYDCYDAGITQQYSGNGAVHENITYADNLVEYCNYGIEFFNETGTNKNISYTGNILRFAGFGHFKIEWREGSDHLLDGQVNWKYYWYSNASATSLICGWRHNNPCENFVATGNILDESYGALVYALNVGTAGDQITLSGNTYNYLDSAAAFLYYIYDAGNVEYGGIRIHSQNDLEDALYDIDDNWNEAGYHIAR